MIGLSKNKPKETIEHVFRLQDKERKVLDDIANAYQINRIGQPVVAFLSDVTAIATVFTALYFLFPKLFEDPEGNLVNPDDFDDESKLKDFLEVQNLVAIGAGVVIAWGTGGIGLIPTFLGVLGGTVAAEGAEEVAEAGQQAVRAATRQARFLKVAFQYAPELFNPVGAA